MKKWQKNKNYWNSVNIFSIAMTNFFCLYIIYFQWKFQSKWFSNNFLSIFYVVNFLSIYRFYNLTVRLFAIIFNPALFENCWMDELQIFFALTDYNIPSTSSFYKHFFPKYITLFKNEQRFFFRIIRKIDGKIKITRIQ